MSDVEQAGLTAAELSERTKIRLHKIEALENGRFVHLAPAVLLMSWRFACRHHREVLRIFDSLADQPPQPIRLKNNGSHDARR